MTRLRLVLLALLALAPSFVHAQTTSTGRVSADVFKDFSAEVYSAAKNAEETAARTADARVKAAEHFSRSREALQTALGNATITIEKFLPIYTDFLGAHSDMSYGQSELQLADAKVVRSVSTWNSTHSGDVEARKVFANWFEAALKSHFAP